MNICANCIVEKILGARIDDLDNVDECSFCHEEIRVADFSDVADWIRPIYSKYVREADELPTFAADSDDVVYEEGGDDPLFIMQEIVGCEPEVAEALVKYLENATWHEVADGATPLYDSTSSRYEIYVPVETQYWDEWDDFCSRIKHVQRFFNQHARIFLDALFTRVIAGDLSTGILPAIQTIQPSATSNTFIFRGRAASTKSTQRQILAAPARELAPPPPTSRTQGRMNPAGIAAFYGCFEAETCVAELRIPVGGSAIVGKFELMRPIRVLDLRAFDQSFMRLSFFDDAFEEKHAYVEFLRQFHGEVRKPVLPDTESLEYLPMQVLAEYLATQPDLSLDGVVYATALTSKSGTNIVLFQRSSTIRPDAENTYTEEQIEISEWATGGNVVWIKSDAAVHEGQANEDDNSFLRLIHGEMQSFTVKAISYDLDEDTVRYYREESATDF